VPCPGRIADYHPPGGLGVRVDSGLYTGYVMPPYYDSMVAKLIVKRHDAQRVPDAAAPLARGIRDRRHRHHHPAAPRIIGEQAFIDGDYDIHWLEKLVGLKK
jgi:acetyl-CoA carboxylase biotin carboxylase subunit